MNCENKRKRGKKEGKRDIFLDICNFYFYPIEINVEEILFFDRVPLKINKRKDLVYGI